MNKWNDFGVNDFKPFTGSSTERYENGEKKEEGRYEKGKKSGKWFYYNKDGSLKKTIDHSIWSFYESLDLYYIKQTTRGLYVWNRSSSRYRARVGN